MANQEIIKFQADLLQEDNSQLFIENKKLGKAPPAHTYVLCNIFHGPMTMK